MKAGAGLHPADLPLRGGAMFGAFYRAAPGRRLRPIIACFSGGFSMPWLAGILSILCLAPVAHLTVSALRIRRPLGCMPTAAILVTFPTALSAFTYRYTAFAYFFSLLLAAFGAWARPGLPGLRRCLRSDTYFRFDLSMRPCRAYSVRLPERIESCDGYQPTMNVVLVGSDTWEAAAMEGPPRKRKRCRPCRSTLRRGASG